jgi:hypothetical protein
MTLRQIHDEPAMSCMQFMNSKRSYGFQFKKGATASKEGLSDGLRNIELMWLYKQQLEMRAAMTSRSGSATRKG